MEVSKITELTVFESPDGGRTVYARRPGESVRQLHSREPALQKELGLGEPPGAETRPQPSSAGAPYRP